MFFEKPLNAWGFSLRWTIKGLSFVSPCAFPPISRVHRSFDTLNLGASFLLFYMHVLVGIRLQNIPVLSRPILKIWFVLYHPSLVIFFNSALNESAASLSALAASQIIFTFYTKSILKSMNHPLETENGLGYINCFRMTSCNVKAFSWIKDKLTGVLCW